MIKKIILTLFITGLLIGCAENTAGTTKAVIIHDALGREVAFSRLPDQIVIAGKQTPMLANFAYLFDGNREKIAAIENRSQSSDLFLSIIDDQYLDKLTIEKGAGAEQISPLNPDLVILKTGMKDEIGDQLETIGANPVYVSFETIEEIYRDTRVFGALFDDPAKAEAVIRFYEDKKSSIDKVVMNSNKNPDVLILQISETEGDFSYSVPSPSWLQTTMVDVLHSNAVWKDDVKSGGWMDVNLEQVIAWQPEIIIVINYQGKSESIITRLREDDVWSAFIDSTGISLKPFPYDFQSWDQPDTRWILGYASLARHLHPDTVEAEYVLEIVRGFYQQFYGLELSFINENIIPDIRSQIE